MLDLRVKTCCFKLSLQMYSMFPIKIGLIIIPTVRVIIPQLRFFWPAANNEKPANESHARELITGVASDTLPG
jgi:hypothetical protein